MNSSTAGYEERNFENSDINFGGRLSSVKRQRERHVIFASSQDDNDCESGDSHHDGTSTMDCDNDAVGPIKRRRFAYAFPFDNNGRIIQQKLETIKPNMNDSTVVEECVGMTVSKKDEGSPPVEWWRKKRPLVTSVAAIIGTKSIVEQDASSSCSAMDTSIGDDEICCHICQNSFSLPISPSVREVMPVNALLNYFSPLNTNAALNGDIAMATESSHHCTTRTAIHDNRWKSLACCPCCDRPSCPECRRECQICQKSFCSFCSITRDDDTTHCAKSSISFCLDCNDRLR